MKEGRYQRLGRFDAEYMTQFLDILKKAGYSDEYVQEYKKIFLEEFKIYSDKGRKKGEPENEGCIRELEDIANMDILNPLIMAKWLKEHQHTKYQKENVRRERTAFFLTNE